RAPGAARPNQTQKRRDPVRVARRPCAFAQPPHRLLDRERLPVGPLRRHRVEGVADEDDPRLERDRLTRERVRIARAVPPLVAVADDRPHLGELVDRREDPLAELGVLLDLLALLGGEWAALAED